MPIYQTARFQVRPAALEKCKQAIKEFVAYVHANEPGTLQYASWQASEDPTRFEHIFVFADQTARDVHSNSKAVKRFSDLLYPECLAPVEFTEYSLVAEKTRER
jgi:quinol monooxygenase YgiN